ncbi:hypothetical protein JW711_05380 [Candidatus Woesearchaeota archaeon]|nr:hypothetical protein [Candidatus Woesearchaeota archaeon]
MTVSLESDKWFYFSHGRIAKSIEELHDVLKETTPQEFAFHVNATHNDYANWIEGVFGDQDLADKLKRVMELKDTLAILEKHISRSAQVPSQTIAPALASPGKDAESFVSEPAPISAASGPTSASPPSSAISSPVSSAVSVSPEEVLIVPDSNAANGVKRTKETRETGEIKEINETVDLKGLDEGQMPSRSLNQEEGELQGKLQVPEPPKLEGASAPAPTSTSEPALAAPVVSSAPSVPASASAPSEAPAREDDFDKIIDKLSEDVGFKEAPGSSPSPESLMPPKPEPPRADTVFEGGVSAGEGATVLHPDSQVEHDLSSDDLDQIAEETRFALEMEAKQLEANRRIRSHYDLPNRFIVKEFIYGFLLGLIFGLIMLGTLMNVNNCF